MMTDVREQLEKTIEQAAGVTPFRARGSVADAILERFEVTPKPVVTAEELGRMVCKSASWAEGVEADGQRMLDQLAKAGLKIVRVDW